METPSADSVVAPNPCFPRELVESPAFLLARLGVGLKTRAFKEFEQVGFSPYHYSVLALLDEGARETHASTSTRLCARSPRTPTPASYSKGPSIPEPLCPQPRSKTPRRERRVTRSQGKERDSSQRTWLRVVDRRLPEVATVRFLAGFFLVAGLAALVVGVHDVSLTGGRLGVLFPGVLLVFAG